MIIQQVKTNFFSTLLDPHTQKVDEQKPDFLAVHFQEVGGKNYEESMVNVETFIRNILDELKEYDKVCILLDEDFTNVEKFTVSLDSQLERQLQAGHCV